MNIVNKILEKLFNKRYYRNNSLEYINNNAILDVALMCDNYTVPSTHYGKVSILQEHNLNISHSFITLKLDLGYNDPIDIVEFISSCKGKKVYRNDIVILVLSIRDIKELAKSIMNQNNKIYKQLKRIIGVYIDIEFFDDLIEEGLFNRWNGRSNDTISRIEFLSKELCVLDCNILDIDNLYDKLSISTITIMLKTAHIEKDVLNRLLEIALAYNTPIKEIEPSIVISFNPIDIVPIYRDYKSNRIINLIMEYMTEKINRDVSDYYKPRVYIDTSDYSKIDEVIDNKRKIHRLEKKEEIVLLDLAKFQEEDDDSLYNDPDNYV